MALLGFYFFFSLLLVHFSWWDLSDISGCISSSLLFVSFNSQISFLILNEEVAQILLRRLTELWALGVLERRDTLLRQFLSPIYSIG
jgi:hypothetical protein